MARRRKGTPPSYCHHKQSGQAVFNWPLGGGKYKTILLGKHGSPESHTEYERLLAEWRAAHGSPAPALKPLNGRPADLTLYEIALQFDKHAEGYYRHKDGRPTGEADNFQHVLRPLLRLYGHRSWRDIGPNALRAVQLEMVAGGLARKTVNARINRIRRFFRWAASREMVPGALIVELGTVMPIRKGQQFEVKTEEGCQAITARESPGVHDIPWSRVEAVMPLLPRPVVVMVGIMRYSNCRAEDVVIMRGCDFAMKGEAWEYRPEGHKNEWREENSDIHKRIVYLGPRCQALIRPFLKTDLNAYLFSPKEARAEYRQQRAANRTTKRTPSELNRERKGNPQRAPRERYDVNSFQQSVRKACRKAKVPVWTVLQVRHTRATEIREEHGVEGAAASLGDTVEAAQIYAEKNRKLARRIALEMG